MNRDGDDCGIKKEIEPRKEGQVIQKREAKKKKKTKGVTVEQWRMRERERTDIPGDQRDYPTQKC